MAKNADAMAEEDISVAILYPGNRLQKVAVPLMATRMDVDVKPKDAYSRDVVLLDNADRHMIVPVLRKRLSGAKIVYRMRGDVYRELETWDIAEYKKRIATDFVLPQLDGVVAVNRPLADKISDRAGVSPAGVAGLAVEPDDWPRVDHRGSELRCLTLTNANYRRKIEPIMEWAPVVERWLDEHGGRWIVGGEGVFDYLLIHSLRDYEHVHYGGFVDAEKELADANLVLHPSRLDGLPNGILEPMACSVPVVTNDFVAFTEYSGPVQVTSSDHELRDMLERARDPGWRERVGRRSLDYVIDHHSPYEVGREYVRYFMRLLSGASR